MSGSSEKLSEQFAARLQRTKPRQKIRALVMLSGGAGRPGVGGGGRGADRAAVARSIRKGAEETLPRLDEILGRFGGRRLGGSPDVLGSILVEATPAGIRALAASEWVQAVLEDQPLRRVR